MAGLGRYKLSDAVPKPIEGDIPAGGKGRNSSKTKSMQTRESQENQKARNAGPSKRERMVEIGRGQQQAGRQGGS